MDYMPFGEMMREDNVGGTSYQYTGQEFDKESGIHNYRARLYDSDLGRFYGMPARLCHSGGDPQEQFASPFSYAANNPIMNTDPDGEFAILVPMIIGAIVNTAIQGATGNINNFGDFAKSIGIGALSGAAGFAAGQLVSGALGASTTLGGSILNGTLTGAAGGFSSGFVGGAGNSWSSGANFSDGLNLGLKTGGYGALTGGIFGGISSGLSYAKQTTAFRRGITDLGVQSADPVPATDKFLKQAQEAWYPDAPIDNIRKFTVENVPASKQITLDSHGAAAMTSRLSIKGILNGNSNVYFNKNLAFTSAKRLYFTMGHELVHVSQFATLAGQSSSIVSQSGFMDLIEYHAYSYESMLGGSNYGGFTANDVRQLMTQFPNHFNSLSYTNFSWTQKTNFIYPFK